MTPEQIAELEALAAYIARLPSGVERANAKGELALIVTNNLLAILDALKAQRSAADEFNYYMDEAVSKAPEPLSQLGEFLAGVLHEDHWKTAERYLNAAAIAAMQESRDD